MIAGIFAKTFPGRDPRTVLGAVRDAGFGAAQYNLACSGLEPVPLDVPDAVADALKTPEVRIAALSGTCNLAHPDPNVRADCVLRLKAVIGCAARAGIPLVTLCTGSRDADMWTPHPDNLSPEAWADMRETMARIVDLADMAGIHLGIEPEQANVVQGVDDALRLARELQTDRLRIVLDPANLFEAAPRDDVRGIVARAVDRAMPMLGLVHAKDRAEDGRIVPPGTGAVDFPDFFARLAGYDGAVVAHGFDLADVPAVSERMRAWL